MDEHMTDDEARKADLAIAESMKGQLCTDCPPVYAGDKTRCLDCPRRTEKKKSEWHRRDGETEDAWRTRIGHYHFMGFDPDNPDVPLG